MNITELGQVQATVQELLTLRLKHCYSVADPEPATMPPEQRCGTVTTLSGYTEWLGDLELPISIGWDWSIDPYSTCKPNEPAQQASRLQRDDLPRSNIQLLDADGHALGWEDNLRVLAGWVDTQAWQQEVAQAVSACPCRPTHLDKTIG